MQMQDNKDPASDAEPTEKGLAEKLSLPVASQVRRHRTAFSQEQLVTLEQEYSKESYLSRARRYKLAGALNLPECTIKVWFQNRRMKDKRKRHSLPWPPLLGPVLYSYMGQTAPISYTLLSQIPLPLFSNISPTFLRPLDNLRFFPPPFLRPDVLSNFRYSSLYPSLGAHPTACHCTESQDIGKDQESHSEAPSRTSMTLNSTPLFLQ